MAVIDPPWPYHGSKTKNAAAGKHYDLMTAADINALPIKEFLTDDGCVLLWTTSPKMDLAIDALRAWGFHYRGVAFVWVKTRKDGQIMGARGVPPTSTKPITEYVLFGTQKKRGRPFPLLSAKVSQVVLAPVGAHSAKPTAVYDRAVELYGDRPRIEIFAREVRDGWAGWGNEYKGAA